VWDSDVFPSRRDDGTSWSLPPSDLQLMCTWAWQSWRSVLQPTSWLSPVYVNDIIHWKTDQVLRYQVSSCTVRTKVTLDKVFNHGKGLTIPGNSKSFEGPVLNCRVNTAHRGLNWIEWVINEIRNNASAIFQNFLPVVVNRIRLVVVKFPLRPALHLVPHVEVEVPLHHARHDGK
jgi:hypothetical protein